MNVYQHRQFGLETSQTLDI